MANAASQPDFENGHASIAPAAGCSNQQCCQATELDNQETWPALFFYSCIGPATSNHRFGAHRGVAGFFLKILPRATELLTPVLSQSRKIPHGKHRSPPVPKGGPKYPNMRDRERERYIYIYIQRYGFFIRNRNYGFG